MLQPSQSGSGWICSAAALSVVSPRTPVMSRANAATAVAHTAAISFRECLAPLRPSGSLPLRSSGDALGDRHRKDAPLVDALLDFPKSRGKHELIHFCLGAAAHDPRLTLSMAGEGASDQLQLRMPWLSRIQQISAGGNCGGEPIE